MAGENEEALGQRPRQHVDDHRRDRGNEGAGRPRQEEQGHEGKNGGRDRKQDRLPGRADGPFRRVVSCPRFQFPEGPLAHHDCVIHHDAQRKNEAKQRKLVDGRPEQQHRREGAGEGNHDPGRDPGGDPQVQHQHEHDQDQAGAQGPVLGKQVDPALQDIALVSPDLDSDAGRQRRPQFGLHMAQHRGCHRKDLFCPGAVDGDEHGRFAGNRGPHGAFGQRFPDVRQVAQIHCCAIVIGKQRDVSEAGGAGSFAKRAHLHRRCSRVQLPG